MERKVKIPMPPGGALVEGTEVPIRESCERWTELTLEDGAVIRVKPTILSAVRIDGQWDADGNPAYALRGGPNAMTIVQVPDQLKKPARAGSQGKAN